MGNKITFTGRRRPAIDERYTRPQGLYPHRDVDHRKLRKLILDSKLAPCYPGAEEPAAELEECPICFLHYPSLNRSKCCSKGICTECFLQMKSPHVSRPTQCPFCKTPNYAVEYRGAKTMEEKGVEQAEEQKVIEAKIRMRQQELQDEEDRVHRREDDVRQGRVAPSPPAATTSSTQTFPVVMNRNEVDGTTVLDAVTTGGRELRTRGNIGRPVGTPHPGIFSTAGLFATPTVAVDPDSLWFRGGQRSEAADVSGGVRQPILASSLLPSTRIPPPHTMAGNGSTGSGVGGVMGSIAGIRVGGSSFARLNRDDEFDLDLEDIMVMEAIWLSIQEQGPQRHPDNDTGPVAPESMTSFLSQVIARNQDFRIGENEVLTEPAVRSVESRETPVRRNSVTGGLAGAIAALAERQVAGGAGEFGSSSESVHADEQSEEPCADQSGGRVAEQRGGFIQSDLSQAGHTGSSSSVGNISWPNDLDASAHCTPVGRQGSYKGGAEMESSPQESNIQETGRCEIHRGSAGTSQAGVSETYVGALAGSCEDLVRQMDPYSEGVVDASSEARVESASLSTPVLRGAPEPSTGAQTEANRDVESGQDILPDSFEEQMMLAMALSLADAQARDGGGDDRESSSQTS